MAKLLLISFDAVGDSVFPALMALPNFARLAAKSRCARGVKTVFLSNTYPVHASVVTGLPPGRHGIISNTRPFPARHPQWCYEAKNIRTKTLWQAAAEKGLATAAVLWPVTAGAKEIAYNIPELMPLPGQNQVLLNMKYGSKGLQAQMLMRHRRLLSGKAQPQRDIFATACMADILREKRPHLALMHLTAYDSLCHEYGLGSPQLAGALRSMDDNLGTLLDAAKGAYHVILFSDHAQLPARQKILPNRLLVALGHMRTDAQGALLPGAVFFECCGGSAFFNSGALNARDIAKAREQTQALEGFGRFLRREELIECGRENLPFGFAAKAGWACDNYENNELATHGYPVDYEGYDVFYLCCGEHFTARAQSAGGSLLDITPLAAGLLNLDMPLCK